MIPDLPSQPPKSRSAETLWSRAIFVSGMVLLVSFGLCGVNFFAVLGLNVAIQGPQDAHIRRGISRALVGFGSVELFGMAIGIIGIIISLIGAGVSALLTRRRT